MDTTREIEFDYQKYRKESEPSPSEINRVTKAREKRREDAKERISQKQRPRFGGTFCQFKTLFLKRRC